MHMNNHYGLGGQIVQITMYAILQYTVTYSAGYLSTFTLSGLCANWKLQKYWKQAEIHFFN